MLEDIEELVIFNLANIIQDEFPAIEEKQPDLYFFGKYIFEMKKAPMFVTAFPLTCSFIEILANEIASVWGEEGDQIIHYNFNPLNMAMLGLELYKIAKMARDSYEKMPSRIKEIGMKNTLNLKKLAKKILRENKKC